MNRSDLRCKQCAALLGKEDHDGITIQRGGVQATFVDPHSAVIVCYRCSTVNVFTAAGKKKPA